MSQSTPDRPANGPRRLFVVLGFVVAVLIICGIGGQWLRTYIADKAVKEELAKAKAAGMLTTLEDVKRFIGPAPDESQNAASFYRKMTELKTKVDSEKLRKLRTELKESPSPKTIAGTKALLAENSELIKLAEEAAKLPYCYFDHDWTLGYSLVFPHYSTARSAALLLIVRAQAAYHEGRDSEALSDFARVRQISEHMRQDKTPIAFLVSASILSSSSSALVEMAGKNPPGSVWEKELSAVEKSMIVPSYRDLAALDLYSDLMMFKDVKTPESREKRLGLDGNEGIKPEHHLLAAAMSLSEGERTVIAGRLMIWRELEKGDAVNWDLVSKGAGEVVKGYMSDPYLIRIQEGLGSGEVEFVKEPRLAAYERKLLLQGALRVLRQTNRRDLPDFTDLVSPVDSKAMHGSVIGGKVVLTFLDKAEVKSEKRSIVFSIK